MRLLKMLKLSPYTVDNEGWVPTIELLKKHIGLSTNVFPNKTRLRFLKSVITVVERYVDNDIRDEEEAGKAIK